MDSAMPTGLFKEGTLGPGWQGAMILPEDQSKLWIAFAQHGALLLLD